MSMLRDVSFMAVALAHLAVDVLNAQRALFQAEFDYLSSRYDYIINGVKLHQATSTLSRDVLAKGNAWLTAKDPVAPPAY
jgi:outer membrane protein